MSYRPTLRHLVAAEVRAEMARQRKTGTELASLLECSQQSASRRMNGEVGMSLDEVAVVAEWLEIPLNRLLAGAA